MSKAVNIYLECLQQWAELWGGWEQTRQPAEAVGTHIPWKRRWDEEHEPKTCRADIPDTVVQQTHKSNLSQSSYKAGLVHSFQDRLFQLFNLGFCYFKLRKEFSSEEHALSKGSQILHRQFQRRLNVFHFIKLQC